MLRNFLAVGEEFEGKYVALRSFVDNTVIASGDEPKEVMETARGQCTKGEDPVIVFVPKHGMTCIY